MWWLILASPVLSPLWLLLINAFVGLPVFPPWLLTYVVPLFLAVGLVQAPPILQSTMRATLTEEGLVAESLLGRRRRLLWSEISAL